MTGPSFPPSTETLEGTLRVGIDPSMISFVVPAYDEERYLRPTLAAIHASARALGERYEIVVADDASADATSAIAREMGARVVHVEKRQIAATRNAGARAARGDRLVFVPLYFRLARWAAGCFLFCTRAAFEAAGGFDERYYASEEIWLSKALKRAGRFVILGTFVTSSARKLEGRTPLEILGMVARLLAAGRPGLMRRGGATDFWYPKRR